MDLALPWSRPDLETNKKLPFESSALCAPPFKGLSKLFKGPFKGLSKAFKRTFQRPFKGPLKGLLKGF